MNLNSGMRSQLTFFNESSVPADMQNFSAHNAPTWSPDGKQIAFSFYGKIWVIEPTGFNLETILPEGENLSPAWSPDGTLLAFISIRANKGRNIHLLKRSSSETWALTHFPSSQWVSAPAWSPQGNQIAFTVSSGEETDIWTVHPDGSHLARLTHDKHSHSPAWSPDGKHLAFSSGRQDLEHWEIWVMNADGSGAFSVTRNGGGSPAWRQIHSQAALPPIPVPTARPVSPEEPIRAPRTVLPAATPKPAPQAKPAAALPKTSPAPALPQQKKIATQIPAQPTSIPTMIPTKIPTRVPTKIPTKVPSSIPTTIPTKVPTTKPVPPTPKPVAAAATKPQSAPTSKPALEENYDEYEQYAEADKAVLPDLNIKEDKQDHQIVYMPKIIFYFAKDLIKPESFPILSQLAEELGKNPEAPLVVQGKPGGPAFLRSLLGKSLSRARANSVLRHLIVTEKIKQINVTAIGEGDEFPDLGKRPADQPVLLVIVQ